jgi:hypothetical protein
VALVPVVPVVVVVLTAADGGVLLIGSAAKADAAGSYNKQEDKWDKEEE